MLDFGQRCEKLLDQSVATRHQTNYLASYKFKLPAELWQKVFSNVRDLRPLSRVNRYWNEISTDLIWRYILITKNINYTLFYAALLSKRREIRPTNLDLRLDLDRCLISVPIITSALIEHLDLSGLLRLNMVWAGNHVEPADDMDCHIYKLISKCTKLRELHVQNDGSIFQWSSIHIDLESPIPVISKLESLSLDIHPPSLGGSLLSLLCICPLIKYLHVEAPVKQMLNELCGKLPNLQALSLKFERDDAATDGIALHAFIIEFKHVKILKIQQVFAEVELDLRLIADNMINLTSLEVNCALMGASIGSLEYFIRTRGNGLRKLSLRTLRNLQSQAVFVLNETLDILAECAMHLEYLSIGGDDWRVSLDSVGKLCKSCPMLRIVKANGLGLDIRKIFERNNVQII